MYDQQMQGMIQNGQFGTSGPSYNPYSQPNNMVSFGAMAQQVQAPSYQPQSTSGYVFGPIGYGAPQYGSPYGGYVQPQYSYYDPYGSFNQQTAYYGQPQYGQYGSSYGYGYDTYAGYRPFTSPLQQQKYQDMQTEMLKKKFRMVSQFFGTELNEEELDKRINPSNPVNRKTREELADEEQTRFMNYCHQLAMQPTQVESQAEIDARILREMSYNMHKELDNHSLCQFLEDDLWKLQREEWIRKYINKNANRNLSKVYDSAQYNELLNMHRSSNPYVNELLDNSRYDNNVDDFEIGMNLAMDRERRRKQILEGKVPTFISSEETQKRRNEFTSEIMKQIYSKGGRTNV